MPITSSAKKAVRVSNRRHLENLTTKNSYKNALKTARKAVVVAGQEKLSENVSKAQSSLDKAVKKHLLHKNSARRLLSRLIKYTNKVSASETKTKKISPKSKKTTKR